MLTENSEENEMNNEIKEIKEINAELRVIMSYF